MTNHNTKKTQKTAPDSVTILSKIWRHFLSGVLVTAPLALTAYIVWLTITTIDDKVKSLLPAKYYFEKYIPFDIPGFGIIIAFVVFTLIGTFAAGFLGRLFVKTGEKFVNRMPVVRGLYSAVKQIFEAVFKRDKNSFREVVLIEYPRKGLWSIGFVTGVTQGEVQQGTKQEVVNVFVPTTPNPTSGYLLFVPRSDLTLMSMSVEEGIKMVVSAGIITPNHLDKNSPKNPEVT
ncbi:MAG TPA: hypothetical protein DD412_00095 [Holosporales bacterium]|nr:hypothetical protein [Holosporales bacterium]